MLYKLYGLTAVDIILTGMSPKLFRDCLNSYSGDPYMLTIVKRQFEELEKVISSIPNEYINPLDKRAYARLRRLEMESADDPQIPELRKQLEGKPMDIANFLIIDGERKYISDVSKAIILQLKKSLSTIKNYKNFISINYNTESEQLYFGFNLYHLRAVTEGSLVYSVSNFLKRYEDRNVIRDDFWKEVKRFVGAVLSHSSDDEESVHNLTEPVIEDVREFISGFDYRSLNGLLSLDVTLEDYYKSCLELHDIGLIGFTPFIDEMFKEFLNNYSPSYTSEIKIGSDSVLYKFAKDLERGLDSHLKLGDKLVQIEDSEEIEIVL